MRRLSPRVNVIPVIGKADSLTPSELRGFKKRVSCVNLLSILVLIFRVRSWKTLSTMIFQCTTSPMMLKKTTRIPFRTTANSGLVVFVPYLELRYTDLDAPRQ